jgi:hypothetical protein
MPTRKKSYKGIPIRPIYGVAIYGVIKTGNAEEKKKLAV